MKPNNIITMLDPYQLIEFYPLEGVYTYNQHGKVLWLQRLLFWILSKLKCQYMGQYTRVQTSSLDIEDVLERVMRSESILREIYHTKPKYLVVGKDYYHDLMTHEMGSMMIRYDFPHDYRNHNVRPDSLFGGMSVICVPWMEGMVVLPELG